MGLKPLPNALIISDFVSFFANHPAGVVSENFNIIHSLIKEISLRVERGFNEVYPSQPSANPQ